MSKQTSKTTVNFMSALLMMTVLYTLIGITLQQSLGPDAVHMTQIKSITLYNNGYTTGRRTRPIPQLKCVGRPDRSTYEPNSVECGYERNGWSCNAKLPSKYKFGKMNVNCEGYRYAGDEYVLKGSCSLEYSLEYSREYLNQQNNGGNNGGSPPHHQPHYRHEPIPTNPSSLGSFAIVIVVLAVIGCIWLSKQNSSSTSSSYRVNNEPPSSRTYDSMYPDVNPNYVPENHHTSADTSSSSIPTFVAGAAAGYAASSLYNSYRNNGTGGNGSYFDSSSYGNSYSNYENQSSYYPNNTYTSSSHHYHDDDDTKDHTVSGISSTSR